MISITFQANDVRELCEQILIFEKSLRGDKLEVFGAAPIQRMPMVQDDAQIEFPIEENEPPKKTKGRKKKAEVVEEPVSIQHTNVAGVPTREAVHESLQAVIANAGLPTARGILEKFGATRLSDVTEDKWLYFIAECESAIQA